MTWQHIDHTWLRLYVHLNRDLSTSVEEIAHLLPYKKIGRPGKESGMSSLECKKRSLQINSPSSCWNWPEVEVTEEDIRKLLSIAMEIAVQFFFHNFTYTFDGEYFVHSSGGPIGAHLTMVVLLL